MNAVVFSVVIMMILSLSRISVVFSLIIGAFAGAYFFTDLSLMNILDAFNNGLGGGAKIALSYATLGAFAVAISRSGLPDLLATKLLGLLNKENASQKTVSVVKYTLLGSLTLAALSSQNLIPVHIAFIPILIPPLLGLMNKLKLDRRAVASVLTFGLITPYMLFPTGFGGIYLIDILMGNLKNNGLDIEGLSAFKSMLLPACGMLLGVLIAVFYTYRKPREYKDTKIEVSETSKVEFSMFKTLMALVAIVATLVVQLQTDSMILGALLGFAVFVFTGVVKVKESDDLFTQGMRMMAQIGFIMITAQGFAEVMKATGHIDSLVAGSMAFIGDSKLLAAFLMLLVGLLITIGIGSSFSTVPIIAALYVPLAMQMGFSPAAIVALVGTAGALGDAGSPASDSTLGPTSGLNLDGQHHHIKDSVIPTFIHYNIPLLIFGCIAAVVL